MADGVVTSNKQVFRPVAGQFLAKNIAATIADGHEISIKNDWGNNDSKGLFLKKIHRAACQNFKVVLGPNYNSAHHDHFHFDQVPSSVCR
jgi:hypothetical protein